jgi:hypothetical protein
MGWAFPKERRQAAADGEPQNGELKRTYLGES